MWEFLPNELWDMVLEHTDQKDLASLNRVCKPLKRLTEPFLYTQIHWTDGDWSQVIQRKPRIHLLLRSVINRPELANYIKHATFKKYIETGYYQSMNNVQNVWWEGASSGFNEDEMTRARDLVKRSKLSCERHWLEELDQGASDVIIALLLSRLISVQSLDLQLNVKEDERPFISTMFRQALTSASSTHGLPSFSSLKTVSISSEVNDLGEPHVDFAVQVAPFFSLPAIETLDIDWIGPPRDPLWPGTQPVASTLTTLIIRECNIEIGILDQLLAATPSLKKFDCGFILDANNNENFYSDKLGLVLREHTTTTLESLTISVYWGASAAMDINWGYSWGIEGMIGSMKGLTKLKYLKMGLVVVLGYEPKLAPRFWEVLPDNLESFTCTDDMATFETWKWTADHWIERLTDYIANKPRALKSINLPTLDMDFMGWPDSALEELELACEEVGVQFRIPIIPDDDD